MKFSIQLEVPSNPELLGVVRGVVKQVAAVRGFSEEQCRALTLGVDEAVTNIIRHAYHNERDRSIRLTFRGDDAGLEFVLEDEGGPADPEKLRGKPMDELRAGGRGTQLIRKTMDAVEYERRPEGNRLRLVKNLAPAAREETS